MKTDADRAIRYANEGQRTLVQRSAEDRSWGSIHCSCSAVYTEQRGYSGRSLNRRCMLHGDRECFRCGSTDRRLASWNGDWRCSDCIPPSACRCGRPATASIDRLAKLGADDPSYDDAQVVRWTCPAGHITTGQVHPGPGPRAGDR